MQKRICTPISRRWLLLLLAVILAGANAIGQDNSANWYSYGFFNGRFWTDANQTTKLGYIMGFNDALSLLAGDQSKYATYSAKGFTFGDYVKELDKLYSERENILLPVPLAIRYCAAKFSGNLTNAELEQLLMKLRKAEFRHEEPTKP